MLAAWRMVLILALAASVFAAGPLGSVSSMGPVDISGTTLSASTVSSWPLVAGDVIATGATPAVVSLAGKGRVTLEANSRVRLEKRGDQLSVRLLGGGLSYDLLSGAGLQFFNGSRAIAPTAPVAAPAQGSVATSGASAPKSNSLSFSVVRAVTRPRPSVVGP